MKCVDLRNLFFFVFFVKGLLESVFVGKFLSKVFVIMFSFFVEKVIKKVIIKSD